MLVYGDHVREEAPAELLERISAAIGNAEAEHGLARHEWLTTALIEAGQLWQGCADERFDATGEEHRTPMVDALASFTVQLARAVCTSLAGRQPTMPAVPNASALPGMIRTRLPEGFSFYALYPETYAAAAQELRKRNVAVVGIRSIGTALGAMVAAGAGGPQAPMTVRPFGDPFSRQIRLSPQYRAELQGRVVAIADEGPGLSGSSFSAVAEALEPLGCEVHLFPSHRNGPGPKASPSVRERWEWLPKHVVDFESLIEPRLIGWVSPVVGIPTRIDDISGGNWRAHVYASAKDWPPVCGWQERRKYLLTSNRGKFLLKYSGLGRLGLRRRVRGERLARAGFTPEVLGLAHGFLVQRWMSRSGSLSRAELVDGIGAYLGFLALEFPSSESGASPEKLREMIRRNVKLAGHPELAEELAALESGAIHSSCTDNRMQSWEWLVSNGRLIKLDALDHHEDHDLVGAQDIAWDIAGATVEFGLDDDERARLVELVTRRSGRAPARLPFHLAAYLAFRIGQTTLQLESVSDPEERGRLRLQLQRYVAAVQATPRSLREL